MKGVYQVSILAIACAITTFNARFRHSSLRPYRTVMYAGLGLSAIIFVIHGVVKHGWKTQNHRMSLDWMGLMASLNLVGAFAYAARVGSLPGPWWDGGSPNSCTDTGKMVSADVRHIPRKSPDISRHGYTGRFGPHGRFDESVWSFTRTDYPLRIITCHVFNIDDIEIMLPATEFLYYCRENSVSPDSLQNKHEICHTAQRWR